MRIAIAADERTGVADTVVDEIRRRGHEPLLHGALTESERDDWAWASEAAARDVAAGRAEQAIVCCWTGTGASIAANKVPGIRAALCGDAATAGGARRWNDANVLALSLRTTSAAVLEEILDAWFAGTASAEDDDRANVAHLDEISGRVGSPARRPRRRTTARTWRIWTRSLGMTGLAGAASAEEDDRANVAHLTRSRDDGTPRSAPCTGLRPGGWLLVATLDSPAGGDVGDALAAFRSVLWGGGPLAPAAVERLLAGAGFADIAALPRTAARLMPLVARRP